MSLKTAESLISQVVTKISAGRALSRSEPKLLPASKEADMRKMMLNALLSLKLGE